MRNTIVFVVAIFAASAAYAQTTAAPANGPLVLERIHDGWVLAPETRLRPSEHTPARAIGPEVGGELP